MLADSDPRGNSNQALDPDLERQTREKLQESGEQQAMRTDWKAIEQVTGLSSASLSVIKANWRGDS